MSEFTVGQEPPRQPAHMEIVGVGVIVSCLLLSILFGWGIYLNLTTDPCAVVLDGKQEIFDDSTKGIVAPVQPGE